MINELRLITQSILITIVELDRNHNSNRSQSVLFLKYIKAWFGSWFETGQEQSSKDDISSEVHRPGSDDEAANSSLQHIIQKSEFQSDGPIHLSLLKQLQAWWPV